MDRSAAPWQERVLPDAFDNEIIPFWEGLKRREFLLWRCEKCGAHYWPITLCRGCEEVTFADMALVPTSGNGNIFSFTVVHRVNDPIWEPEIPYCLVLVELDEGPIFPSRLSGKSPDDLAVGMRVKVDYVDVPVTGMTLPLFQLA